MDPWLMTFVSGCVVGGVVATLICVAIYVHRP